MSISGFLCDGGGPAALPVSGSLWSDVSVQCTPLLEGGQHQSRDEGRPNHGHTLITGRGMG